MRAAAGGFALLLVCATEGARQLEASLRTGEAAVAGLSRGSVDGASRLAGGVLQGLAAGVAFAAEGEVAPEPERGGDSYGGEGKTFEPLFGSAESTVIVLHGLGARVAQVVPIVPIAQIAGLVQTRFILPQAPVAYVNYRQQEEPVRW